MLVVVSLQSSINAEVYCTEVKEKENYGSHCVLGHQNATMLGLNDGAVSGVSGPWPPEQKQMVRFPDRKLG